MKRSKKFGLISVLIVFIIYTIANYIFMDSWCNSFATAKCGIGWLFYGMLISFSPLMVITYIILIIAFFTGFGIGKFVDKRNK